MKNINSKKVLRFASLVLAAVILVVALSACTPLGSSPIINGGNKDGEFEKLELIDKLFETYSLFELDEEALMDAVLKGYVAGTGDKYAEYFTEEEYEKVFADNKGELVGIGIRVTQNLETSCIEIISVMPNSPAQEAGVLPGDLITAIGVGENALDVNELGYTVAVEMMGGELGSLCEFSVTRSLSSGTEKIEFSIERKKIEAETVMSHVCEFDSKVGIVKILEFNIVTPSQFCEAVDGLLAKGCDKFIFDVRNNPGGDLKSIQAVLSYFLNDNDVYIRVSNKKGAEVSYKVAAVEYKDGYAACSVTKEELGKYRDLCFAVLTNRNTASAAELFTGTLKDYGLSLTVGTTTYGKGTMQSTHKLSTYGYSGAIKLTTKYYYPPISESYEGIGIEPDVKVELDPSLEGKNIYTITDAEDNQLGRAIEELYKKNNNKN